jgi:putative transcriptional regulator
MRTFDDDCLVVPPELTPDEIEALREKITSVSRSPPAI